MPGRASTLGVLFLALLCASCAPARRPHDFRPAAAGEGDLALAAWGEALARGASLPPSRLLYEAKLSRGLGNMRGTLAMSVGPTKLEGLLAGPFGKPLARIVGGVVEAEGGTPFPVEPEELRALLSGTWPFGAPEVRGIDGGSALLSWSAPRPAAAVLDLKGARLASLSLTDPRGEIEAFYDGAFAPWPEKVDLTEKRSGNRLRLTLAGREAGESAAPAAGGGP
jgi:hypothetical protein